MEFLDLKIMLLLATGVMGFGFNLVGLGVFYGIKIFLLLKKDKDKMKKPQEEKKSAKKKKK